MQAEPSDVQPPTINHPRTAVPVVAPQAERVRRMRAALSLLNSARGVIRPYAQRAEDRALGKGGGTHPRDARQDGRHEVGVRVVILEDLTGQVRQGACKGCL